MFPKHAQPGDAIEFSGPRGRIVPVADAAWHLFSGDETALPAISSLVEALPDGARAFVFLEVDGPGDHLPVQTAAQLDWRWLHRAGAAPGGTHLLVDAIADFVLPPGEGHAYLLGETGSVTARRQNLRNRGLRSEQISAEGYWRPGRIGGHDHVQEPEREIGRAHV
jgi:NADPH-dependent ferric siderophore reductase